MIISDLEHHKIDVKFSPDNYLQITTFHCKAGTDWYTKLIALSPENQDKIIEIITKHRQELLDSAGNK